MAAPDNELIDELKALLGGDHVLTTTAETDPYRVERRGLFESTPVAIVRPATTDAVAAVVATCARAGAAIVPQGGNTGLVGGSAAAGDRPAVVLSLERLNRVRAADPDNRTLTVEAGCLLADVQAAATDVDCYFPLSYAAEGECRLGGNLATNAGGMNVLRYGNARELTLGLEVVLADGRIWNGLTALRKDNSGYDLRDLFIGAEGTLGIITAAVVRLFPRPRQAVTAVIGLDRAADAVTLLHRLQAATGGSLSAFELMSRFSVATAVEHMDTCQEPFATTYPWYALLDATTPYPADDMGQRLAAALDGACREGLARDWRLASEAAQRDECWRIRNNIPAAQRHEGASIKHDIAVPIARVPEFLERADDLVADYMPGIRPCAFGHVGDGNIHYNLSQPADMDAEDFLSHWRPVTERVHDLVATMGGSFAAEHGVGRLKTCEVARLKDPVEVELMRSLKQALDPEDRMNPGAVVPWNET